jgi:hypothetical protein
VRRALRAALACAPLWGAVCLAALLGGLAAPAASLADADPASDILLIQDEFYPYMPGTSPALKSGLARALAEIKATGLPLKVAIVGSPTDLGGVPELYGMPVRYARFLESEIAFNRPQPLLVVMPAGLASAAAGSPSALAGVTVDRSHGSDGLARTAVLAVERIAAARGHPIAAPVLPKVNGGGAGGTSPIVYIVPVVLLVLVAGGVALRRPRGEDEEGYLPDDADADADADADPGRPPELS